MKLENKIRMVVISVSLALGCQTKEERYQRNGIVKNYALANGYDIKFGPTIRGYKLTIGDLTKDGFSETYILANDFNHDGNIDYFEVIAENSKCYQSSDAPQRLDSCKINPKLKELASINHLNQVEEVLLHEHR